MLRAVLEGGFYWRAGFIKPKNILTHFIEYFTTLGGPNRTYSSNLQCIITHDFPIKATFKALKSENYTSFDFTSLQLYKLEKLIENAGSIRGAGYIKHTVLSRV